MWRSGLGQEGHRYCNVMAGTRGLGACLNGDRASCFAAWDVLGTPPCIYEVAAKGVLSLQPPTCANLTKRNAVGAHRQVLGDAKVVDAAHVAPAAASRGSPRRRVGSTVDD